MKNPANKAARKQIECKGAALRHVDANDRPRTDF
jgi:hypothetical protein